MSFIPRKAACAAIVSMVAGLQLPQASADTQVWFAADKSVRSNDLLTRIPLMNASVSQNAIALAADGRDGKVWALTSSRLYRFGATGTTEFDKLLKDLSAEGATLLAADPRDGSLWLAESSGAAKQLIRFDSLGQPLVRLQSPDTAESIVVDLDGVLWVLAKKRLYAINAAGQRLVSLDVSMLMEGDPKYFAVDTANDLTWVAGGKRLIALRSSTPETREANIELPFPVRGVAIDAERGTVWVITEKTLAAYDAQGRLVETNTLTDDGIVNPSALAFHPATRTPVVAHNGGITRMGNASVARLAIPLTKEPSLLVAAPLRLTTQLSLSTPIHASIIAQALPEFVLNIGQFCSGNPCTLPVLATDRYHVSATLNGASIGSLFSYVPANNEARFQPMNRLPEGVNRFGADVTDTFGNVSNAVAAEFTIDTIPPSITGVVPLTGFVTNKSPVTVSGAVSEPARVTVNGQSVALGTNREFSTSVALVEGGNAISIQATDPAGNTGGRTLEVSLDTVPPRLMSVTPASGSTVAVAATRVAGTFDDAATVTITWSGGTKTVSTKEFSFDVVLLAGANTLTLSAIDAAGNVASVPLTLTFNPVQYDPVDAPYLSVWEAFKSALSAGDHMRALEFIAYGSRERYARVFNELGAEAGTVVGALYNLQRVEIQSDVAEYFANQREIGTDRELGFFIYFVRDGDGVWRISTL